MTQSKQKMFYNVLVRWRCNKKGLRVIMGATYNTYGNFESLCVTGLYALNDFQGQCYCLHDVLLSASALHCNALTPREKLLLFKQAVFFY